MDRKARKIEKKVREARGLEKSSEEKQADQIAREAKRKEARKYKQIAREILEKDVEIVDISDKFSTKTTPTIEESIQTKVIGLTTLDEYEKTIKDAEEADAQKKKQEQKLLKKKQKKEMEAKEKKRKQLSAVFDEEDL